MELKITFFGTSDFAVPILDAMESSGFKPCLIVTAPDKPAGRHLKLVPPPVKIWAIKHGIQTLQPAALDASFKFPRPTSPLAKSKTGGQVSNFKPNLFVVAAYGKILPKEILDIPNYGALNIHPSLLPRYRGPSPIQAAILNGDKQTGVSIILMDEKMDHGNIISNLTFQISNREIIYKELEKDLAELGGKLLVETIPKWVARKIKPEEQSHSKATYTKIITKQDGKIDWQNETAEFIERKIRAFQPWPGTYSFLKINGKSLRILFLKARVIGCATSCRTSHIPGQIFLTDSAFAIQCKKDALLIERLKPEGKSEMSGSDFIKKIENR